MLQATERELMVVLRCIGSANRRGDGELRTCHYIYVYSQSRHCRYVYRQSRLIMTMGRQADALVAAGVRWSLTPERAAM